MKITQIEGIEAADLLTQFQKLHTELILIKRSSEPPKKDKLLTRKQTAEILQVSLVTLWNWTKKGTIKAYRIGNKIRYKESEIIEALQVVNAK
ncbi:helix-turn-helix domain-containing protein [Tenacibaculum maritimum]|uniref:Helix-turn-helix domain-containing protein n=1 Tax=Tenacibaculum maritimum NCIMB 2154 TaxID=1349785 RepID=A0A2H1E6Q1_9FLAO|nr:helix-turn-helix domain-containing protein [Tenacibaculum maritimum]CAA0168213.1 conserved hypothetical protein [Tenacibaculum maritimum]CAA0172557.1 conserved hypothetical protein [Tenacibaculum maritimum]CAA0179580.1 conserved hypothetical protein [Tenacibaculum maritimum]CAA0186190.1 conserved hypothetical protein [Tenacibaculum maritimum]SFZ80443.1 conserved protein of unknown function [Tenacibaculum maritimum NCIMB 2154]